MNPFQFHTGLIAEKSEKQSKMDCPFCQKEEHFFFNDQYLWDCKSCGKSGNLITFLRLWYEQFDNLTKTSHILSEARGIPVQYFQEFGIQYNQYNGSYLLPTYKKGKINNLYKISPENDPETGKEYLQIRCSMGMDSTIFNWDEDWHPTIWVCEGHFDKLAAECITRDQPISCIGVPGANIWDTKWLEILAGKDVVFLYDNDDAGKIGFETVILKHIANSQNKPKSISYLEHVDKKKGYDVNDYLRDYGKATFQEISSRIKPFKVAETVIIVKTPVETIMEDKSCDTYDKLLTHFKELYYTTPDMELGLLLMFISIYSLKLEGDQVWIKMIGPAGSGKSSILKAISACERVVLRSTLTGLFSGHTKDGEEENEDHSLIPIITGNMLGVKDADALLQQPNIARIMSEFRDFYDKDSSTQYRTGKHHDYQNRRCTVTLCGTNALRKLDNNFLGERFMDFELNLTDDERKRITEKSLQNAMQVAMRQDANVPEMGIMAAAKGFANHLSTRTPIGDIPHTLQRDILTLTELASKLRTKVDRARYGNEITFAPIVEVPSRLIKQLVKVAMCCPIVLGEPNYGPTPRKLVYKIIRDIIDPTSIRYRICSLLSYAHMTGPEIADAMGYEKNRTPIYTELDNLRALKIADTYVSASQTGILKSVKKLKLNEDVLHGLNTLEGT